MSYDVWSGTTEELRARVAALRLLPDQWEQLDWPTILDVDSLPSETQRVLLNPSPSERVAAVLAMPVEDSSVDEWTDLHGGWGDVGRPWGCPEVGKVWVRA